MTLLARRNIRPTITAPPPPPGGVLGVGHTAYTLDLAPQQGGTTVNAANASELSSAISARGAGDTIVLTGTSYGALSTAKNVGGTGALRIVAASAASAPVFTSLTFQSAAQGIDIRGIRVNGQTTFSGARCSVRGGLSRPTVTPNAAFECMPGSDTSTIEGVDIGTAQRFLRCQAYDSVNPAANVAFKFNTGVLAAEDFVHLSGVRGCIIQGNHMTEATNTTAHVDGVQGINAWNVVIDRNVMGGTAGSAFEQGPNIHTMFSYSYDDEFVPEISPQDWIVTNNLGFRAGSFGIEFDSCWGYCHVINNTVYDTSPAMRFSLGTYSANPRFDNLTLQNNAVESLTVSAGVTPSLNRNNFAPTYSGPTMTNRLVGSPGFVGGTTGRMDEYAITAASQLRGAGYGTFPAVAEPYLAVDLIGNPRPATPSVGCYEYIDAPPSGVTVTPGDGSASVSFTPVAGVYGHEALATAV